MTRRRVALATGFLVTHVWLAWLGVVVVPAEAFWDVDLYRWWAGSGLTSGTWPVLDGPWVYPVGALVPMLLPALVTTASTPGYAVAWCVLVAALDAVAVAVVLRSAPRAEAAVWWWLAFLALLGPVAIGRLDGVVTPIMLVALVLGLGRPRVAAALLAVGAWVKVGPGALLLPLAAAARRPMRDVVVPAAVLSAAVLAVVGLTGGLPHVLSFLSTQGGRGLQVESVTATPWVIAAAAGDDAQVVLNEALVTYEVQGPGTSAAATTLDALLPLAVAAVGAMLLLARRRGRAAAAFVPAALVLVLVLVVVNKVGSPQFVAWLAAPVVALLSLRGHTGTGGVDIARTRTTLALAGLALVVAGLTQVVFPWSYLEVLGGEMRPALVLAVRNLLLVTSTVLAVSLLVRAVRPTRTPVGEPVGEPGGQA